MERTTEPTTHPAANHAAQTLTARRVYARPAPANAGNANGANGQRRVPRRTRSAQPLARVRRIATVAASVALLPVLISFFGMVAEPSNTSLSIRYVEWLRSNGAAGVVNTIESFYYTLTAPSKGGPALRRLPHVGVGGAQGAAGQGGTEYHPSNIAPLTSPPLPGEGVWVPTRRDAGPNPPVLVTTFRSEPAEYPRIVAGVAWINTKRTHIQLYPGRLEPSAEMPARGPEEVPPSLRTKLLATFNSGFKVSDSHGGFALNGHSYVPLRNGQATLVGYTNGTVDVIAWQSGPNAGPEIAFARQNLPLLVEEGRPSLALRNGSEWGTTLGNAVRVWRSGIGVDSHGNLIYAAANDQTASSLANILIHAGAVRAMELDINSYWVSFNSYGAPGAAEPQKLLSEIERPATRYLEPDDRDFFAVYEVN
ncbi:MAG: phosphodiester glycosidase family protein [Solirubrobacteraceae bacterium]